MDISPVRVFPRIPLRTPSCNQWQSKTNAIEEIAQTLPRKNTTENNGNKAKPRQRSFTKL